MLLKIAVRTHFVWRANSPILHKYCESIVCANRQCIGVNKKTEAYVLLNKQKKVLLLNRRARARSYWMNVLHTNTITTLSMHR